MDFWRATGQKLAAIAETAVYQAQGRFRLPSTISTRRERLAFVSSTPERLDVRDVSSRTYWGQMCPNFSNCHTADAQGKECPTCGTPLRGFVAEFVTCPECGSHRFYCLQTSRQIPGKPDLRCLDCDGPMDY